MANNWDKKIIIHNLKGKKVIDELSPLLDCQKVEIDDFLQPQLKSPPSKGEKYDVFWNDYFKKSERAIEKWFFPSKKKQFFKELELLLLININKSSAY